MEFTITVSEGYALSPIYLSDDQPLKELALTIGANVVELLSESQGSGVLTDSFERMRLEAQLVEQRDINSRQQIELEEGKRSTIRAKEELEMARRMMNAETAVLKAKFSTELEETLERERKRLREQFTIENREQTAKYVANGFEESKILPRGKASSVIGRDFEEMISNYMRQTYGARPGFTLEDVHSKGHTGDLILTYDGTRVMFELKNYASNTKVPSKEVEKLVRDIAESDQPCHAAVMISANCEITGHYTCGNFEISNTIAKCPVLFVNNFLSLGDPLTSLHMVRVFLDMVAYMNRNISTEEGVADPAAIERQKAECIKRCSEFIAELDKHTSEIIKQVNLLQATSTSLKKSVTSLIESEIAKFESIKRLLHFNDEADGLDSGVFRPPHALTDETLSLARILSIDFKIDNSPETHCSIKELLGYIMGKNGCSEKRAREMIKSMFLDHHINHRGYVTGIAKLP